MPGLLRRRMTASVEGDFVVFLIGMRINRWWRVDAWLPMMRAMPAMIRELEAHPELGFLGAETFLGRTICMVQYWQSIDKLMDYARSPDRAHLPAWRAFNQRARSSGAVGVWHETYAVPAGRYETVYVNMPRFGLGAAGTVVPAEGRLRNARDRLARPPQEARYVEG